MARLASVPDLDQELDRLYGLPPDRFVKERDALAARLRQAHQVDAAGEVAKLRKPVAVAWAANRLAREQPDALARLLDAADRLRAAQQRALGRGGTAAEVSAARADERKAIAQLLSLARAQDDPPVPATALERLGQTLLAAAAEPGSRELLLHGRLGGEVAAVGFEALAGLKPAPPSRVRRDEVALAARERVKALRAEARRLAADARSADQDATIAERTAVELRAAATAKSEESERTNAELEAAQKDLHGRT